MREHICFETISCKFLQYVPQAKSWVCIRFFDDIPTVDLCMTCKFQKQMEKERELRKKGLNGRFL